MHQRLNERALFLPVLKRISDKSHPNFLEFYSLLVLDQVIAGA